MEKVETVDLYYNAKFDLIGSVRSRSEWLWHIKLGSHWVTVSTERLHEWSFWATVPVSHALYYGAAYQVVVDREPP